LLPIRGHLPAQMFLFVLPAIALVVLAIRRRLISPAEPCSASRHARTGWIRYSLRDLFLAVLLSGVIVATVMAAWRPHGAVGWRWLFASGGCLVLLAVLSTVAARVPRRRLLWLAALAVSVAATAALHAGGVPDWAFLETLFSYFTARESFLAHALACVEFSGLILLTVSLARCAVAKPDAPRCSRRQFVACGLLVLEAIVLLLPPAVFYRHMLHRPRLAQQSCPRESNFPQLLAVAEQLEALNAGQLTVADLQQQGPSGGLAKQVAELHATMLTMVGQPGFVPYDPTTDSGGVYIAMIMPHLQTFRSIAGMWQAEAEAAAKAQRFDVASRYGLACVQLGNTLSRGGTLADALVGVSTEEKGVGSLSKIRGEFSATQVRAMLAHLEQIEQSREPAEATLARDAVWEDETFGWVSRFSYATAKLTGQESARDSVFRPCIAGRDACLRLLRTDLALRLFRQERGRLPERLDELVPQYLAALPVDPFSDQPLVYHRGDGDFLLYSVGRDGADNGGHFGSSSDRLTPGYDLDLDIHGRQ
jgi:hypothetical protein